MCEQSAFAATVVPYESVCARTISLPIVSLLLIVTAPPSVEVPVTPSVPLIEAVAPKISAGATNRI